MKEQTGLQQLRTGQVLLYPSDTLWALGCDARNSDAVARITRIKQRPEEKSFIILLDSVDHLEQYASQVPAVAYDLIEFAEHPLTLVLDGGKNVSPAVLGESGSIAIRIIAKGFCHELIRRFQGPLVSTSANLSGEPAPVSFEHIPASIRKDVDFIVPEVEARNLTGKPSTIIRLAGDGTFTFLRR